MTRRSSVTSNTQLILDFNSLAVSIGATRDQFCSQDKTWDELGTSTIIL